MTRPSLADITQHAEARAAYEERPDVDYDPDEATDLACASAADVPALVAALRAVLDVADEYEGDNVLSAAPVVREIRRAVTAHINTTPKEKP